jgi:hypothetical protein
MAATDLTAPAVYPFVANITLGTGGNVRLVNLPSNMDLDVILNARTTDAKLLDGSLSLADDAAISTNPYLSLKAGIPVTVTISRGGGTSKLYLASTTSSQVVEVVLQRRQLGA